MIGLLAAGVTAGWLQWELRGQDQLVQACQPQFINLPVMLDFNCLRLLEQVMTVEAHRLRSDGRRRVGVMG